MAYNPFDVSNKTVLITGSSSGIGREIAVELDRMGARLILYGRNAEKLEKTLGLLQNTNKHLHYAFDLKHEERRIS